MLSKSTTLYLMLGAFLLSTMNTYANDKDQIPLSPMTSDQLISKKDLDKKDTLETKPRLEDYATYNDFLHAMYLYNKFREETIKPYIIIDLPNHNQKSPEYTNVDENSDVNNAGEDMSTLYSTMTKQN